jgi:polyhydroxyalkanoate synthase subunit PhaC
MAEPQPHRREWPRPLPLHLGIASAILPLSSSGLIASRLAWPPSSPASANPPAARPPPVPPSLAPLLDAARQGEAEKLQTAVLDRGLARARAFLDGVARYRSHPYRRQDSPHRVAWTGGAARLLDYAPAQNAEAAAFFVPSLVNRHYILDLMPGRSLMAALAARGIRSFLLDWGAPGAAERGFALENYLDARLLPAFDAARAAAGRNLAVVGYCMGGMLALALALRRRRETSGLGLLATPWDFHAERPEQARMLAELHDAWRPGLEAAGGLPVDLLQAIFLGLDPLLGWKKFRAFAAMADESDEARAFVALEDWLNDGVMLTEAVAAACFRDWYGANLPGRGAWRLGDLAVQPAAWTGPTLAIVPAADRIVPPGSALALAAAFPACHLRRTPAGHIGMVSGRRAPADLWAPLGDWIRGLGR